VYQFFEVTYFEKIHWKIILFKKCIKMKRQIDFIKNQIIPSLVRNYKDLSCMIIQSQGATIIFVGLITIVGFTYPYEAH